MNITEIINGLNIKIAEAQKNIDESKKVIHESKTQIRKLQTLNKKANEVLSGQIAIPITDKELSNYNKTGELI